MKNWKTFVAGIALTALIAGCISPELRTARIAIKEGDNARALAALDKELQRMPGSPEPLYLKGAIYEDEGNWEMMNFWWDSSLAVSDQFASKISDSRDRLWKGFYNQSLNSYKDSSWVASVAYLDTAAMISPNEIEIYQQSAITAYFAGNHDKAIESADKAISLEKEGEPELGMREILVLSYRAKEDWANVAKYARDLMENTDPKTDTTNIYLKAVDALLEAADKMENYDAAIEASRQAIERFPKLIDLKMNLGVLLLRDHNYEGAKEVYREVLAIDPTNFDANLYLGTILVNEEKWSEAIPLLEEAYRQGPDNVRLVTNLMAAYYNSDQHDKGKEMKAQLDKIKQVE